jgi:hypothetical protein
VKLHLLALLCAFASCPVSAQTLAAAHEVTLLGKASIPGDATDLSGLTADVSTFTQARLGSFGSAIEYLGKDDLYLAIDDRGPGDGSLPWRCRWQTFRISLSPGAAEPVTVSLVSTTLMSDETGRGLNGLASIHAGDDRAKDLRYDPEGVRVHGGMVWVSDEYGPWIDGFSTDGRRVKRLPVPARFRIAVAGDTGEDEMPPTNTTGRQANRGFEGLAISPDGTTLWAILQSPLLQDGGVDDKNERIGLNIRILEIKIKDGAMRELVYPLEKPRNGVNEIVALSDRELLVLERDGKAGTDAKFRGLFLIDIADATDVSKIESLGSRELPEGVRPVRKRRWLDLLDPAYGLAGPSMPEKIEGLATGPALADGRRTLIVTTDNDLKTENPSWFWVFAFK